MAKNKKRNKKVSTTAAKKRKSKRTSRKVNGVPMQLGKTKKRRTSRKVGMLPKSVSDMAAPVGIGAGAGFVAAKTALPKKALGVGLFALGYFLKPYRSALMAVGTYVIAEDLLSKGWTTGATLKPAKKTATNSGAGNQTQTPRPNLPPARQQQTGGIKAPQQVAPVVSKEKLAYIPMTVKR
jgi:hypothetical protein